eukprot:XP_011430234.1 PREDICTED: uncharacterized protein LOC105330313 [Crassostrea gigas]
MAENDHEDGPSTSKRRRTDSSLSPNNLPPIVQDDLSTAIFSLCSTKSMLLPYKITSCNAASSNGVSFSKAYCELENLDRGFFLGDVFRRGVNIVIDFLYGNIPKAKHERILLEKLVNFLKSGERVDADFESETELTTLLANHLFGKLASSPDFTIDKSCKSKRGKKCSCSDESCVLTGDFGDTSIGNLEVWHGSVDIIIKNDLVIENLEKEPDSPGGKSPVEVKMKSTNLSRNPQLVAETVVFSFLQKKTHPELSNFLIPCVGIASSAMLLMFYDSEHDVFLESSLVPLLSSTCKNMFTVEAVLVTWLAVNYRFLCTGLTDEMLPFKACFFEEAKNRKTVYENDLQMHNVGQTLVKEIILPNEWEFNDFLMESRKRIGQWKLKEKK